jgi:shikimate dehydrogenase
MTAIFGVFGWPVAHSLSPVMHQAAYRALAMDAVYVPFPVRPEKLAEAVMAIRVLETDGINVTLPHKTAIIPLLSALDDDARAIGAVNTVLRRGDALIGANTDADGLTRALEDASIPLRDARVTILGAGGAARASVVGLAKQGVDRITIAARRPQLAAALAEELGQVTRGCALESVGFDALEGPFRDTTLLVQATSATLQNSDVAQAFADSLPMTVLPADAAVIDLVYRPVETTVLARAVASGHRTVDGLGMLLHQGAIAFEMWTGHPAPLGPMRAALLAAL